MKIEQSHPVPRLDIQDITVPVESNVFAERNDAELYIGIVAMPGAVTMPEEYEAWLKFRGNVYIDEMGFLPESARDEAGRETDEDDDRSVHFVVLQNETIGEDGSRSARVVGGARLILKHEVDDRLPVESMYPETFTENAAPLESSEVSRLIARHANRGLQSKIGMALIRSLTSWTYDNGRKPVYAVIEEDKLGRLFKRVQLPYEAVSDPKWLDEYASVNTAIAMNPPDVLASVGPIMRAFYDGVDSHKGLGYFDETLIGKTEE